MRPPIVATSPEEAPAQSNRNNQMSARSKQPQVNAQAQVVGGDDLSRLQAMFPAVEREQIEMFYQMNNWDIRQTKAFIGQQIGALADEEEVEGEEAVDPEDVEFNLLAGQVDPNVISEEERKMIEKAIRDSEMQERQVRQSQQQMHVPPGQHQAVRTQHPTQTHKEEGSLSETGDKAKKSKNKKQKKVDKKDGNNCCVIF